MAEMFIGPFGNLLEVRTPSPPLPVELDRPSSETRLLSGVRRVQHAPRLARRWRWTIPWAKPDAISSLMALEAGAFGVPPWRWYEPMAARMNLLVAGADVPVGSEWWRWFGAEDVVSLGGALTLGGDDERTVRESVAISELVELPAKDGTPDPVPVLPHRIYTASVYVADETTTTLELRWVDVDGVVLSTSTDMSVAGSRRSVAGASPENAAGVLVAVDTDGRFSAAQLTETPDTVRWYPGAGVPRVTVVGAQLAYRIATEAKQRTDVSVEIVEVG